MKRSTIIVIIIGVLVLVGIASIPGTGGSQTYAERADDLKKRCISSMRFEVDQAQVERYCAIQSVSQAVAEMKHDHPQIGY